MRVPLAVLREWGPSPRGRGSLNVAQCSGAPSRSIPAWAGKPTAWRTRWWAAAVHPRVGGEAHFGHVVAVWSHGPSPRGRGSRQDGRRRQDAAGSIPAWAGKPQGPAARPCYSRVHPRVGGEAHEEPGGALHVRLARVHPRVGGEAAGPPDCETIRSRSIPAWAGKPAARASSSRWIDGPSPRGRGSRGRARWRNRAARSGSIPAWAGKPLEELHDLHHRRRVHPRVGGEARQACRWSASRRGVHPRVGGEAFAAGGASDPKHSGPSPRGRGSRQDGRLQPAHPGSIPAWAGKPTGSRWA